MEGLPQEMQLPGAQLTGEGEMAGAPPVAPEVPGVPGEGEFVSEEKRQGLLSMIEDIRGKVGEANAAGFATDNMQDVNRSEALQQVFSMMQEAGVDLTDPQSVGEFIEKLRESNPDMAALFEESMNQLLGGEAPEGGLPGAPEGGLPGAPAGGLPGAPAGGLPGAPAGGLPAEPPIPAGPGTMPNLQGANMNQNENIPQDVRGPVPQQ